MKNLPASDFCRWFLHRPGVFVTLKILVFPSTRDQDVLQQKRQAADRPVGTCTCTCRPVVASKYLARTCPRIATTRSRILLLQDLPAVPLIFRPEMPPSCLSPVASCHAEPWLFFGPCAPRHDLASQRRNQPQSPGRPGPRHPKSPKRHLPSRH